MTSIISRTLAGGEITPELQARKDLTKVQSGVALSRNVIINRFGGGSNRAGFEYLAEVEDSSDETRIIPFIVNNAIAYVIELGDQILNAYSGSTKKTSTAVATPWAKANLFDLKYSQSGNTITVTSNDYPPYEITRVSDTSWTCSIKSQTPVLDPPKSLAATAGAGTSNTYYYGVTAVDDNGNESYLGLDASGVISPGGMGPFSTAYEDYDFTVQGTSHGLTAGDRVWIDGSTHIPGFNKHTYTVKDGTSTNKFTLEDIDKDSIITEGSIIHISTLSQANPCEVTTVSAHGLSNGNNVYITGSGMVELNDRVFVITVTSTTTFTLNSEDSTSHTAGAAGFCHLSDSASLRVYKEGVELSANTPTTSTPNVITWTAVSGAKSYNVYKKDDNGTWGLIGITTTLTFDDTNITPDVENRPPTDSRTFANSDDYPGTVAHTADSRIWYGNTDNNVERLLASRINDENDLATRIPIIDDDPIDISLRGRQVNSIEHLIELGQLVVLTQGAEIVLHGDGTGKITPVFPNPKAGSYRGSSKLRPITVGTNALYVQAVGQAIRDLKFDFGQDTYVGTDLSEFASHLFDGRTIVDWAYQQTPNSIVWMALDDGTLLGLTYVPEQDIWAFHRHDSVGGSCESLCCIPEGDSHRLYAIWNRTVDGNTVRYIERMHDRVMSDYKVDAIFLDSYLSFDGRNTGSRTMTITTATNYNKNVALTLTASSSYFTAAMVGNKIKLRSTTTAWDNNLGKNVDTTESVIVKILSQSGTTAVVVAEEDVPTSLQNSATTDWDRMVNGVTGLDHLEGEVVYALADGESVSGYDNTGTAISNMTVDSGAITLDTNQSRYAAVIHVGLFPYADLETLDVEVLQGETISDKKKNIRHVALDLHESAGAIKIARSRSDTLRPLELNKLTFDDKGLRGGITKVKIGGKWMTAGRVFIRQTEPLPMTIKAVIIDGEVGDPDNG